MPLLHGLDGLHERVLARQLEAARELVDALIATQFLEPMILEHFSCPHESPSRLQSGLCARLLLWPEPILL